MEIQRCKECGRKFNYTDVLDSVCWTYKSLHCKKCGVEHRLKMFYIFILAILLSIPILLINRIQKLSLTLLLKILMAVLFYLIYIALIVGLYPFIVKYKLKEE